MVTGVEAAVVLAAIAAAPAVIKGVEDAVDSVFKRSIIFEVRNATSEPLRVEYDGNGHSHGGFSTAPPHVIEPFTAAVFSARSNGDLRGNMRLVGQDVWFGMSWSNPIVGSNSYRSSVNGKRASEFQVQSLAGRGNTRARFAYNAFYSDVGRLQQGFKAHQKKKEEIGKPIKAMGRRPKKKISPEEIAKQVIKAEHIDVGPL